eukprot:TRINITY_DN3952_c0_g1_i1.p1 TRINITY_DN3952_c0_g1~~TRINITY_DN3952_c0_g1_i1.p1  ORF type:complete len:223 (-),score=69.57 TRINITY_DN3952_c0_g1_i1:54-722(-)
MWSKSVSMLLIMAMITISVNAAAYCSGSGCITKANAVQGKTTLVKGDEMAAYVHVRNLASGDQKALFIPNLDDYSNLNVTGSGKLLKVNTSAEIAVEVQGVKSSWKRFGDGAASVNFWTVLLRVVNGKVDAVQWSEDTCTSCTASGLECIDNFCATKYSDQNNCQNNECDVRVYLAAYGTDSKGQQLTSAGLIISRFRSFGVNQTYQDGRKLAENVEVPPTQ